MKKKSNFLLKTICLISILVSVLVFAFIIANLEETKIKLSSTKKVNMNSELEEELVKPAKLELHEVVYVDENGEKQDENRAVVEKNEDIKEEFVEVKLNNENCKYSIDENKDTVQIEAYNVSSECVVIPNEIDGKKVESFNVEKLSNNTNLEIIKVPKEIADKVDNIPNFEINESLEEENYIVYTTTREYGEAYKGYLELTEEEREKIDFIPPKYEIPLEIEKQEENTKLQTVGDVSIGSAYDLRDDINVKVENQNPYGICYAYAAFTSAETYWALNHNENIDLSEVHCAVLTTGNGGNYEGTNSYFASKLGPIYEEDIPIYEIRQGIFNDSSSFDACLNSTSPSSYSSVQKTAKSKNPVKYVTETVTFPTITKDMKNNSAYTSTIEEIRQDIKEHIKTYGALATLTNSNYMYEYNGKIVQNDKSSSTVDHGVTIIGWDDNFDVSNFPSSYRPSKNGAYLVLNSWGNGWGNDGCYWISYEDKWIEYWLVGVKGMTETGSNLQTSSIVVTDQETGNVLDNANIEDGTKIKVNIEATIKDEIAGEEIEVKLRDNSGDYTSYLTVSGTEFTNKKADIEVLLDTAQIKGDQYILEINYGTDTVSKMIETPQEYCYELNADGTITLKEYFGTEKEIVVPAEYDGYKVSTIGTDAFSGSTAEKITIEEGITKLEDYAFRSATKMTEINLPRTLKTIGLAAFIGCEKLEEIIVPRSVTTIGPGLVQYCTNLKKVVIFKEATSIGSNMFYQTGKATIYCEDNSIALSYAKNNSYSYSIITENYNITYNKNAGTDSVTNMPNTQNKVKYDTITISSNIPVRSGYEFLGWALSETSTEADYKPGDAYRTDSNLNLYAVWKTNEKEISYIVEYYKDGVKQTEDTQTTKVTSADNTITVDKSKINTTNKYLGYEFEKTEPTVIPDTVTDGTIISVYYKVKNYTITYELSGGQLPEGKSNPRTYTVNDTFKLVSPLKTGFTFKGWIGSNGNIPEKSVIIEPGTTGNKQYKADYKISEYELTIKCISEINGKCLETINLECSFGEHYEIHLPEVEGYTCDKEYITGEMGAEDKIIEVNYTANTDTPYVVNHYKQNIENDEYTLAETEDLEGTTDTYTQVVPKDYEGFTPQEIVQQNIAGNGKTIVNVYYNRNTYKITYYAHEDGGPGVFIDSREYKYEQPVTSMGAIEKYGYIFSGWINEPFLMPAYDVEVSGNLYKDDSMTKELSYAIEYYKNNEKQWKDTISETRIVHITDSDKIKVNKEKINTKDKYEGFTFERSEPRTIPDFVENGTVIKIYYSLENYKISYDLDGGHLTNESNPETYTIEDEITLKEPEKEGYTFIGWTGSNGDVPEKNVKIEIGTTGDKEYKANYTINTYIIEYDLDGGQVKNGNNPETYTIEDEITLKEPEKEGYTFIGWTGSNGDVPEKNVTISNTIGYKRYIANYTIKTYKLTIAYVHNASDKYPIEYVEELEYGEKFEVVSPVIPGYTSDYEIVSGTMGNEDKYIDVYYTANIDTKYVVEHYKQNIENDEYTLAETEVCEGTTDTETTCVAKEYLGFSSKEIVQKNIDGDESTIVKIYYDRNKYTITYIINNEKVEEVETYKYEEKIIPKEEPTKLGYKFSGWSDIPETMPAYNIEVFGYFELDKSQMKEISYTVEYYKNNEKQEEDTIVESKDVFLFESDELVLDKTKLNTKDKYVGYTFEKTEPAELPETANNGDVIKIYYVANIDTKYVVEHYKQNIENDEYTLAEKVETVGTTDTITMAEENDYKGYYSKEFEQQNIAGDGSTIVKIYYDRKDAKINIEFRDIVRGEEIAEKVVKTAKVFDSYDITEESIEVDSYILLESPEELTGEYTEEEQTKVYKYAKCSKVIVNYIDKNSNEKIIDSIIIDGYETKDYETEEKEFENYALVETEGDLQGKMTKEDMVVNYYYRVVSQGVIEKHIDITTNEIICSVIHEGNEGDTYKIEPKSIDGYSLIKKKLPTNAEGKMTKEVIKVEYFYIRNTSLKVQYINKVSNEIIYEEIKYGVENESYTTKEKELKGYELVEKPENAYGKLTVTKNEDNIITETIVKYYYKKISEGVVVKYYDTENNNLLGEDVYQGLEGDSYKVEPKEIEGYDLVEDKLPTNAEGFMTIEKIEVNYFYKKEGPVTSENYLINEDDIKKITMGTTIGDFVENMSIKENYTILDQDGNEVSEKTIIKTGMKLRLEDGKEYDLIVRGDISGDGRVSLVDISKLILHYNGMKGFTLEGCPYKAADMNYDGKVSLIDVSQMLVFYNSI